MPVSNYYDQYTAKERSYIDYIGDVNRSISSEMESNANRQIAANAMFSKEIQSTLINNQIATEKALYNHTQQFNSALNAGFSGISRQLGDMGALMSTGLALLNTSVKESSKAIYNKLDTINMPLFDMLKASVFFEQILPTLEEEYKEYEKEQKNKSILSKMVQESNRTRDEIYKKQLEKLEISKKWEEQGLCRHCGGQITGLFSKKCKSCGKQK